MVSVWLSINAEERDCHCSHLTALCDLNRDLGLVVGSCRDVLDLAHHQESVDYSSENYMFSVQKVALGTGDEELATVGVLARVGHGQDPGSVVLHHEVLVVERGATVDRHAPGPVTIDKVAAFKQNDVF